MFAQIKNPEITGVVSGNSTKQAEILHRSSHMFIFKVNGESVYTLRGKQVHLSAGTVLYIPEHETYSFRKISEGESLYRLVNFHAETGENAAPQLFSLPPEEPVSAVFRQMEKIWRFMQEPGAKSELLSRFYHLTALLERNCRSEYMTSGQKRQLDPAMTYLEKHIFDHSLKIPRLAALCHISDTAFRHIFHVRFGVSPKQYIIRQRMLQAKTILESGEYTKISEVAHAVGYEDPLYFSRHFRSFYGYSPSHF